MLVSQCIDFVYSIHSESPVPRREDENVAIEWEWELPFDLSQGLSQFSLGDAAAEAVPVPTPLIRPKRPLDNENRFPCLPIPFILFQNRTNLIRQLHNTKYQSRIWRDLNHVYM